jgi:hypothetical protein
MDDGLAENGYTINIKGGWVTLGGFRCGFMDPAKISLEVGWPFYTVCADFEAEYLFRFTDIKEYVRRVRLALRIMISERSFTPSSRPVVIDWPRFRQLINDDNNI